MSVKVLVDGKRILIAAAYRSQDGPPAELASVTAAITAKLKDLGIAFTARSVTGTIAPPAPVRTQRRKRRHAHTS